MKHCLAFFVLVFINFTSICFAECAKCDKGNYCDINSSECKPCDDKNFYGYFKGFVCPGGDSSKISTGFKNLQLQACKDTEFPNDNFTKCESLSDNTNIVKVTLKPGEFLNGDKKQTCDEDTFKNNIGHQFYATYSWEEKYSESALGARQVWCPGGDYVYKNYSDNNFFRGFKVCQSGTLSWEELNHKKCETEPPSSASDALINCNSGQYIPALHRSCESCENLTSNDKFGCERGFSVEFGKLPKQFNIGWNTATHNLAAVHNNSCGRDMLYTDNKRTNCMKCKKGLSDNPMVCDTNYVEPEPDPEPEPEKPKSCDAGYINVNGQCVSCTSNPEWVKFAKESRMYCPGGGTSGAMWNTQLKKCPKYKKPNDNLDDCKCIYKNVTNKNECKPTSLDRNELYYGPLGKGDADALYKQCWTKRTKSAYRKCMGFDD